MNTNSITTNSIILCNRCNKIDDVKEGSLDMIKLPMIAKGIKNITFYGQPTEKIKDPYGLYYDLYSEGFHEDRTTYFYEIEIQNPAKGFDININTNIKLYDDSLESQLINGTYPAWKINPYTNGTLLQFYIQSSKSITGLELSTRVEWI